MDKKIVLITIVGLITVNLSCTNKNGETQKQLISKVDSVTLKDSIEDNDTSYLSIYKKEFQTGKVVLLNVLATGLAAVFVVLRQPVA